MIKKIKSWVYTVLTQHATFSDDDLYIYLLLMSAFAFAGFLHIILLLIFAFLDMPEFVLANFITLFVYYLCIMQTKKKNYLLAGSLLTFEVLCYTYASIYFIGCEYYILFLFVVILVLQIIIPYTHHWIRGLFVFISWLSIVASVYIGSNYTPVYDMSDHRVFLSLAFIQIGLSAIIIEIFMGNIIKRVIASYRDQQIKELENMAHTDSLTGLYNRRYASLVFNTLQGELTSKQWCVAILDIDDFKLINDHYGHNAGDLVLASLSDLMRTSLRKNDILFRWGGEEFLILLEDTNIDTALPILEKLRKKISDTSFQYHDKSVSLTITIGVHPLDIHNIWHSIDICDQKLYYGKSTGKNIVVVKNKTSNGQ